MYQTLQTTRLPYGTSLWLRKRMLNTVFIQNNLERLRGHVCCRLQWTIIICSLLYAWATYDTPRGSVVSRHANSSGWVTNTGARWAPTRNTNGVGITVGIGIQGDRKGDHIIEGCCCDSFPLEVMFIPYSGSSPLGFPAASLSCFCLCFFFSVFVSLVLAWGDSGDFLIKSLLIVIRPILGFFCSYRLFIKWELKCNLYAIPCWIMLHSVWRSIMYFKSI